MSPGRIDLEKFREEGERQRSEARVGVEPPLISQSATIRLVRDQLKEARVGRHILICDEPEARGGTGAGPSPLHYFVAAIGF